MAEALGEIARHRPPDRYSEDPFVVGPVHLHGGQHGGPLSGLQFAVKDLYDVVGTRTGAGNPEYLIGVSVATTHAPSVAILLAAGAELVGKTVTDELALSLSGTNIHYGTPRNPAAPGRVPGGSSSGSVSVVADGLVDFALGTDTGGSTRVPASYCGIYGLRSTHGRISRDGVFILATSFCATGVFAQEVSVLSTVWSVLAGSPTSTHPKAARPPGRLLVIPELFELADSGVAEVLLATAEQFALRAALPLVVAERGALGDLSELLGAFRAIQLFEAWELHGDWVAAHRDALGWGIAARFDAASTVGADVVVKARERRTRFQHDLAKLLGSRGYLLQPAASGPAPAVDLGTAEKDDLRFRTMKLTAPAGLAGSPVISMPLAEVDGLPVGLAVVGLPDDDEMVINLAARY